MKETEAIEFLRTRVADEGYIVVGQVPDATGAAQRRTMDALLVQCWPSRGLTLTCVEYKRTVSDFRRELKQPEKADRIARYCHAMLVLAPKGVVPVGELPPRWGLWEIHQTAKRCQLLRTVAPQVNVDPRQVPLSFLVSILRARERYNGDAAKLEELRRADLERERQRIENAVMERTRQHRRLAERVENFEQASGIRIRDGWSNERLGAGLAEFLKNPNQFNQRIQQQRDSLRALLTAYEEVLGAEVDTDKTKPAE